MKRCRLIIPILVIFLAGCTDTPDSIGRELRNTNNEAIDAIMLVVSDEIAADMTKRVFKPLKDRYENSERKVDIIKANRDNKGLAKEFLNSDGVHLYMADMVVNRTRFNMEMQRLANLERQYVERDRQNDPSSKAEGKDLCPNIHALIQINGPLDIVDKELKESKLTKIIEEIRRLKVDGLPEMLKRFEERGEVFKPKVNRK